MTDEDQPRDPDEERQEALKGRIRQSFDVIKKSDLSLAKVEQVRVVKEVFERTEYQSLDRFKSMDPVTRDMVYNIIGESLVETTAALGMDISADFGLYWKYPRQTGYGKTIIEKGHSVYISEEGLVSLNTVGIEHVAESLEDMEDLKEVELAQRDIRKTVAHEVAHVYISRGTLVLKSVQLKLIECFEKKTFSKITPKTGEKNL